MSQRLQIGPMWIAQLGILEAEIHVLKPVRMNPTSHLLHVAPVYSRQFEIET